MDLFYMDIKNKLKKAKEIYIEQDDLSILEIWEKQLSDLGLEESVLKLPQIQAIVETTKNVLQKVNDELMTKRNITLEERAYAFALKDVVATLLNRLSLDEVLKNKENLTNDINKLKV